jgi:hemerythrin-like metal-binding protein
MSSNPWKHEAERGADSMNREHDLQLWLLDRLLGALDTRGDPRSILDELLTVSDLHFATEEVLMRQHSHPNYHLHVDEHRRLMDELRALDRRFTDALSGAEDVLTMRRSLTTHIANLDGEVETAVRQQA